MAIGSLLTYSVMGVCIEIEIEFLPFTSTFFSLSYKILSDALSYTNFLRLGTSFGLKGVPSPKLSPLNFHVRWHQLLISQGYQSPLALFLSSLSFFLCSSSITLFVASLDTFSITSFIVVVASTATFSIVSFCSVSF